MQKKCVKYHLSKIYKKADQEIKLFFFTIIKKKLKETQKLNIQGRMIILTQIKSSDKTYRRN